MAECNQVLFSIELSEILKACEQSSSSSSPMLLTSEVKYCNDLASRVSGKITTVNGGIKAVADEALRLFQIPLGFTVFAGQDDADSAALLVNTLQIGFLALQLALDIFLSIGEVLLSQGNLILKV